MTNKWHASIVRLKQQAAELKDQVAGLRETLCAIGEAVDEQRSTLDQRTKELRDLLENESKDGQSVYQLPSVLAVLRSPDIGAILVAADGRYLLFNGFSEDIL